MRKIRNVWNTSAGIVLLSVLFIFLAIMWPFPYRESPTAAFLFTLNFVVWTFVLPLLLARFLFKKPLSYFGWQLPQNWPRAALLSFAVVVILMPFAFYFSGLQEFQNFYSPEGLSTGAFILLIVIVPLFYFFSEEFLFQGFLFRGLFHKIKYHSFWVTGLVFAALHAGKPPKEMLLSFFVSLIFSYLTLKTKSFIPAFVVHYTISLVLDTLILLS